MLLPFAAMGWADEAADRIAIDRVIAALNESFPAEDVSSQARLFTSDADAREIARLLNLSGRWTESSTPRFVTRRARFVTPDVAVVDAAVTQFGSVILMNRTHWLLIMRKEGEAWRIACVRLLSGYSQLPLRELNHLQNR